MNRFEKDMKRSFVRSLKLAIRGLFSFLLAALYFELIIPFFDGLNVWFQVLLSGPIALLWIIALGYLYQEA